MYHHIRGTLTDKNADSIVVEAAGIGYLLRIPLVSMREMPAKGSEVFLYLHPSFRENEVELFGFATREERALFQNLLRVSKVGPSVAQSLLGQMPTENLVQAIIKGDTTLLSRLKGVGKKTAERIVLELRDRLGSLPRPVKRSPDDSAADYPEDAYLGLLALGLSSELADDRLRKVAESGENIVNPGDWIRLALKHG